MPESETHLSATLPYRRIFGVLAPYFNTAVEPELADLRPTGVWNQTARFILDGNVLDNIADAARKLMAGRPDALIVGLAPENFPGGLALLTEGVERLTKATGVPVFTASHATHAALRRVGAHRVGVVTPFDAESNAHVRAAFEAEGFTVVAIDGLARPGFDQIANTDPDDIRRIFRTVDCPDAQAIVHVGTGLPVLHLLDELEDALGKPVVACNAASYWQALREMGIDDKIQGFGRLLAEY
jgi:maleate isomerase